MAFYYTVSCSVGTFIFHYLPYSTVTTSVLIIFLSALSKILLSLRSSIFCSPIATFALEKCWCGPSLGLSLSEGIFFRRKPLLPGLLLWLYSQLFRQQPLRTSLQRGRRVGIVAVRIVIMSSVEDQRIKPTVSSAALSSVLLSGLATNATYKSSPISPLGLPKKWSSLSRTPWRFDHVSCACYRSKLPTIFPSSLMRQ